MRKALIGIAALAMTADLLAQSSQSLKKQAEDKTAAKISTDLKQGVTFAQATLVPKSNSQVNGTVLFNRTTSGLRMIASIAGGKPGQHGIHIHEKGDCSAPDASSAGGHFNPSNAPHGGPNAAHRHVGDLGNITVKQDGTGVLSQDIPAVAGFTNWNDIIGKAVIIHDKADDLKSQPSGDAGDRIACGVIKST